MQSICRACHDKRKVIPSISGYCTGCCGFSLKSSTAFTARYRAHSQILAPGTSSENTYASLRCLLPQSLLAKYSVAARHSGHAWTSLMFASRCAVSPDLHAFFVSSRTQPARVSAYGSMISGDGGTAQASHPRANSILSSSCNLKELVAEARSTRPQSLASSKLCPSSQRHARNPIIVPKSCLTIIIFSLGEQ